MPTKIYRSSAGKRLPSVTQILGELAKPALVPWAARVAAEAAVDAIASHGVPYAMACERGARAPDAARDASARIGTQAHALLEAWALRTIAPDGPRSAVSPVVDACPEAYGAASRAIHAIEARGLVPVRAELSLVEDERYRYGGTMDLILRDAEGAHYVADLKTGKHVGPEVAAQLSAYGVLSLFARCAPDGSRRTDRPLVAARGIVIHSPIDGECRLIDLDDHCMVVGWNLFESALRARDARLAIMREMRKQ